MLNEQYRYANKYCTSVKNKKIRKNIYMSDVQVDWQSFQMVTGHALHFLSTVLLSGSFEIHWVRQ